jgi:hypothetical protein
MELAQESKIQELRAKFEEAREIRGAAEVRAAAVAYCRARAQAGGTRDESAVELGLNKWTVAKWLQRHDAPKAAVKERALPTPTSSGAEGGALKALVVALGPRNPSRRFPPELKERIAEWAREELARGVTARAVEAQVGVPWESLSRWLGRRASKSTTSTKSAPIRAVRLVGEAQRAPVAAVSAPVLKTPSGIVVEGLDVATLVAVLRALG